MANQYLKSSIVLALSVALIPPLSVADDDDEIPFDEARVFFELNDTDGDLGIHALIDGEPWQRLKIEDTNERKILDIKVKGRLRKQGLTELFFESAEPTFDELLPEEFFARFPEGIYEVEGKTLEGEELESEAIVTHVMPAPAEPTVNGEPVAEECDPEEPGFDAPIVFAPITITWPAVTMSHPDLGVDPPVAVTIKNYEVAVEVLDADFESTFSVVLSPADTIISLPEEFTDLGSEFKYEVLARESSDNQTAVESCFVIAD